MSPEKIDVVKVDPASGYEQEVVEYRPSARDVLVNRLAQLVLVIGSIVVIVLLVRMAFVILGADPANGFASLIYQITNPLVAPFTGIIGTKSLAGLAIDIPALIAIIIYSIVAAIVARLIRLLLLGAGGTRTVRRVERLS